MSLFVLIPPPTSASRLAPALVWLFAWLMMGLLHNIISLGNLALLMVLASAMASLWLRPRASMVVSTIAAILFNWFFISPRFTLRVDLLEDFILLATMLAVSAVISYLMEFARLAADSEAKHQMQSQLAHEQVQNQQLRNTLLTSISHDYRTPLTTVMSSASAIAEEATRASPDKLAQLANLILSEAQQLHRLTSNTLQLARLDSDRVDIAFSWESAEEIMGTVCARVRRHHPHCKISVQLPEHLPLLRCDAILLNQLLDNLIDNALRHGAAHPALELRAQQRDHWLEICVQDHGRGIPDTWKERVFDLFQRMDEPNAATGSERRGIGVGLAVCKAIADAHSGHLTITDTPGGGTTVTLRLPVLEQPDHPAELIS